MTDQHIIMAIPLSSPLLEAVRRSIANPSVADVGDLQEMALAIWQALKIRLECEAAWGLYHGRYCPECGGAGEVYVPADTVYPQPAEWAPCPRCNGWGVLAEGGNAIPPVPPRPTTALEEVPF